MKKVLLATTALVFTAGYAAADGHSASSITISGEAVAGVKYDEDGAQETNQFVELDFGIAGKTTTDGGLEVGASFDLDLDTGSSISEASDDGTGVISADETGGNVITDEEFYISSGGVKLTLGEVGNADDAVVGNLKDVGFDGIGVDDTAEAFFDVADANMLLEVELGEITLAASGNVAENNEEASDDFAVAAGYDAGSFSVGLSYAEADGVEIVALGGSVTAAGADIDLFFHTAAEAVGDEDVSGYGASVTYPVGAISLIGTVGATDLDDDEVDFGLGAEYDLGGGVTLAGGLGQIDDPFTDDDSRLVGDFGIKVKF